MIFGVLNPEKLWHQQLGHLPTSLVYCSHFTLRNPKSFNSIIHSYFRLFTLSQKKMNGYFITHYTWKMSPHYLVKIAQILHLFHFFMCIEYQFTIWMSCGMAASCCNMGCISAEHCEWYSWSVAKKTGGMYPCRRWSLWTSQPVLFKATNTNPQPAHFRSTNVSRNAHTFSQMKMLCILQGSGVTFFRCGG